MEKKLKKYIVTLDEFYLDTLYTQFNAVGVEAKQKVLNAVIEDIKSFLFGDTNLLVNFRFKGRTAFFISALSKMTLKDLRKKGKRIKII